MSEFDNLVRLLLSEDTSNQQLAKQLVVNYQDEFYDYFGVYPSDIKDLVIAHKYWYDNNTKHLHYWFYDKEIKDYPIATLPDECLSGKHRKICFLHYVDYVRKIRG